MKPARAEPAADARSASSAPGSPDTTRFARGGRWVLGLEGLAALVYDPGSEDERRELDAEGRSTRVTTRTGHLSFSTLAPSVSVHAFVVDHVSVGLTAGYNQGTWTMETTREGGRTTTVSNTGRMLALAPGAGVACQHGSGFGVWARGAVAFHSQWATSLNALAGEDGGFSKHALGASVQALATFTPIDELVLSAGPSLHKYVASSGDYPEAWTPPEEEPVAFAVTFGAGLVL